MARVERTKVVDLGTLAVNEASEAIDMRSFTHAVVFVECPSDLEASTNIDISVEFSPEPYGEASDWFAMYSPLPLSSGNAIYHNPIVLSSKELNVTGSPLYEKNRAYPIMPMDTFAQFSDWGYETGCGEYLLPSQMRLTCTTYGVAMKVMLAREID